MDELKRFLLRNISPADFSTLVYRILLHSGYFEINPVEGTNDRGVDVDLYTFSFKQNTWITQISVQQDYQSKVRQTLATIGKCDSPAIGLVYITNRSVPNKKREGLQMEAYQDGYLLHIFDEKWILPRIELSATGDSVVVAKAIAGDLPLPAIERSQALPYFLKDVITRIHSSIDLDSEDLPLIHRILSSCLLSYHLRQCGHVAKAFHYSHEAYSLSKRCRHPLVFFLCCHLHGEVLKRLGRHGEARALFNHCLRFSREAKERCWESVALTNLAEVSTGTLDALGLCSDAIVLREGISVGNDLGVSFGQHSKLSLRLGDMDSALRFADRSLEHMWTGSTTPNRRGIAVGQLHLAGVHLALGNYELSFSMCERAERTFSDIHDPRNLTTARLLKAENAIRSAANEDDVLSQLLEIYAGCLEMADGEGLTELMRIISLWGRLSR